MGTLSLACREHQPRGTTRLQIWDEQTLPTLFTPPHAQTVVCPYPRWRGLFARWWIGCEVMTHADNIVSISLTELSDNSVITRTSGALTFRVTYLWRGGCSWDRRQQKGQTVSPKPDQTPVL